MVKLTSGSTGVPRGVAMRTEHVLADEAALARTMDLRADDRLLAAIPLSHSYGFTTLALSALVRGLTLVLPADRGPFSPLAAARDLGATVFPTVPAYIQALLKLAASACVAGQHSARDLGRRLPAECHGGAVPTDLRAAGARVLRRQ